MARSPMTYRLHRSTAGSGGGVSGAAGQSTVPSSEADDDIARDFTKIAYEGFLRAAASAAGCPAGMQDERSGVTLRLDPQSGSFDHADVAPEWVRQWPHIVVDGARGVILWLEQPGRQEQHRVMLSRLAAALRVMVKSAAQADLADNSTPGAIGVLLDPRASTGSRRAAAARLGLLNRQPLYVTASAGTPDLTDSTAPEAIMGTPAGVVRAGIRPTSAELSPPGPTEQRGVGTPGDLDHLPHSWQQAVVALRLTSAWAPVQHWAGLGGMAVLAGAVDCSTAGHADEHSIERAAAEPWGLETMEAIIRTSGIRSAAEALGLHHSTLQVRRDRLSRLLGYSVDTPQGRIRLAVGLALHNIRKNVFDAA